MTCPSYSDFNVVDPDGTMIEVRPSADVVMFVSDLASINSDNVILVIGDPLNTFVPTVFTPLGNTSSSISSFSKALLPMLYNLQPSSNNTFVIAVPVE